MINTEKLEIELEEADISSGGCNSNGVVWDIDGVTEIQTREDVAAVISAHSDDGWYEIRKTRNQLIADCDWTQLSDAVLSTQEKLDWSAYRQLLRDVTEDYATPGEVIWPIKSHVE